MDAATEKQRAADRHHDARRAPVAAGDAHAHQRHAARSRRPTRALLPQLFSLECWGGATFDVAMRFLKEDPWERLARLREAMPNILFQMLLRGRTPSATPTIPTTSCSYFVSRRPRAGIDLFRIFDSLNWVENMRVAIDAVLRERARCAKAAICYTGDICRPERARSTTSNYYVGWPASSKSAGAHILGIKDMAGLCKPRAAYDAGQGAQGRDRPADPLPHPRHQRHRGGQRARGDRRRRRCGRRRDGLDERPDLAAEPRLDRRGAAHGTRAIRGSIREQLRAVSHYWERCASYYAPFESDIRAGTAEVYVHEMPGGQYTNLREQARALGLDDTRWPEVAARLRRGQRHVRRHRQGDADLQGGRRHGADHGDQRPDAAQTCSTRTREIAFPESVVELFRGELGQPSGGFPQALQRKVLQGRRAAASTGRAWSCRRPTSSSCAPRPSERDRRGR